MEINPNRPAGGSSPSSRKRKAGPADAAAAGKGQEQAAVNVSLRLDAEKIETLLHAMPDVRESVVRFGHELAEREDYPDPERIRRLASMLAEGRSRSGGTDAPDPSGTGD